MLSLSTCSASTARIWYLGVSHLLNQKRLILVVLESVQWKRNGITE